MTKSAPQIASVQSQPLIAVRDVRISRRWYQQLLGVKGLPEHEHRNSYDRLMMDGRLILQLHAWDERITPISSTPTRRQLDMESCYGSNWTTSTLRSNVLAR